MSKCYICNKSILVEKNLQSLFIDIIQEQEYLRKIAGEQLQMLRFYSATTPKIKGESLAHQKEILKIFHNIHDCCNMDISTMFCPDHYVSFIDALNDVRENSSKFEILLSNISPKLSLMGSDEKIFRTMLEVLTEHFSQKVKFLLEKIDKLHLKYCMSVLKGEYVDDKSQPRDLFYSLRFNRTDHSLDVFKEYKVCNEVIIHPQEFYNIVGKDHLLEYAAVRFCSYVVTVYICRYGYFYCSDDGLIVGDKFYMNCNDCIKEADEIK